MPKYDDHAECLKLLKAAQEAEYDNREKVREVSHFLEKDDGQWEPSVVARMTGRPRYTFDKCNPVVDSIAGEMDQAEFAIKVRPSGGDSDDYTAKIFDGLIRSIQAVSGASHIYGACARKMVAAGFDAWRVVHDWVDGDSFEQDLLVKKIANSVDRVWFDQGAENQDMSDAMHCFVLQALTKDEYDVKFPDGSGRSVDQARESDVYTYKPDLIMVGEFLYKSPVTREIVLMANGAVYEADDKFSAVADDLKAQGITEERRRKVKGYKVYSRLFDGDDWLSEAKETVFDYIPVIPVYANFQISENKVIYRGAVNNLMDPQRVHNYALSRAIEEGALAPRGKYWMTREQAATHQQTLQTMNTNSDPVQLYTHVEGQNPPFWQGGAQINSGLQQVATDMASSIIEASGVFSANQGNAPGQSGYAIELQQNKGDNSTIKYFKAQEIAITHTARVLINAIPKVYDTKRTVRILGEDGTSKMVTINDDVYDAAEGKTVSLYDLRKGKYDVVCDVGPAFKSRQQETARSFIEAAGIDPKLLEFSRDIWLRNLNAPGFDLIAERARRQLLDGGMIPDSQMTEDEKERAQQIIASKQAELANQPPDPLAIAMMEQTQANTADIASRAQERANKAVNEARKQEFEEAKFAESLNGKQFDQMMEQQKAMVDALNKQAQTLKLLREAMGADAIIGPGNVEAYKQQAEIVEETQDSFGFDGSGNRVRMGE
jgi:hypothetical protein